MIGIKYFYDIPVYRVDQAKYFAEMDEFLKSRLFPSVGVLSHDIRRMYETHPDLKASREAQLTDSYGGQWQFNEIIGYIRLHFLGSQIRGEYHAVSKKRIVKTRTKQIEYQTWKLADEIDIPMNADNKSIYDLILEYLSNCKKELKGRYVDIKMFESIGQFVNWENLFKNSSTNHSSGNRKRSGSR